MPPSQPDCRVGDHGGGKGEVISIIVYLKLVTNVKCNWSFVSTSSIYTPGGPLASADLFSTSFGGINVVMVQMENLKMTKFYWKVTSPGPNGPQHQQITYADASRPPGGRPPALKAKVWFRWLQFSKKWKQPRRFVFVDCVVCVSVVRVLGCWVRRVDDFIRWVDQIYLMNLCGYEISNGDADNVGGGDNNDRGGIRVDTVVFFILFTWIACFWFCGWRRCWW